jgi:hypothetical protein
VGYTGCGLDPASCIVEHWCQIAGAIREPAGWRAACPVCGAARRLSIQVKGPRPSWKNHCGCPRADVRAKLAALMPQCVSARYTPRRAIGRDDLIALAEDRSLHELALRVALLELAGIGVTEACDRLAVSRAQRYRLVSQVRQRRRS